MLKCSACGHENDEGSAFCGECGAALLQAGDIDNESSDVDELSPDESEELSNPEVSNEPESSESAQESSSLTSSKPISVSSSEPDDDSAEGLSRDNDHESLNGDTEVYQSNDAEADKGDDESQVKDSPTETNHPEASEDSRDTLVSSDVDASSVQGENGVMEDVPNGAVAESELDHGGFSESSSDSAPVDEGTAHHADTVTTQADVLAGLPQPERGPPSPLSMDGRGEEEFGERWWLREDAEVLAENQSRNQSCHRKMSMRLQDHDGSRQDELTHGSECTSTGSPTVLPWKYRRRLDSVPTAE